MCWPCARIHWLVYYVTNEFERIGVKARRIRTKGFARPICCDGLFHFESRCEYHTDLSVKHSSKQTVAFSLVNIIVPLSLTLCYSYYNHLRLTEIFRKINSKFIAQSHLWILFAVSAFLLMRQQTISAIRDQPQILWSGGRCTMTTCKNNTSYHLFYVSSYVCCNVHAVWSG